MKKETSKKAKTDKGKGKAKNEPPKKYNYTMKTGRPTGYKKSFCKELKEFFSKERFSIIKDIITTKKGDTIEKERYVANELPTFQRFATNIGFHTDTLYEWEKKHREFSETMNKCREIQQDFLIQNGLTGLYQSNFAMFVATNYTKMKVKQEHEHSGTLKNITTITEVVHTTQSNKDRLDD